MVHFERNVLSSVPASSMGEVAEAFVECFAKAISVFEAGIDYALTYLDYPGSHRTRVRTTNMPGHLFEEENESGVGLRSEREHVGYGDSLEEQWALQRYLTMHAFEEAEKNQQLRDIEPNKTCALR